MFCILQLPAGFGLLGLDGGSVLMNIDSKLEILIVTQINNNFKQWLMAHVKEISHEESETTSVVLLYSSKPCSPYLLFYWE